MKFLLLSRRNLLPIASGFALSILILSVLLSTFPSSQTVSATPRKIPIYCVDKNEKVVAISFDAAWGFEDTQQLIDILAQFEV